MATNFNSTFQCSVTDSNDLSWYLGLSSICTSFPVHMESVFQHSKLHLANIPIFLAEEGLTGAPQQSPCRPLHPLPQAYHRGIDSENQGPCHWTQGATMTLAWPVEALTSHPTRPPSLVLIADPV